MQNREKSLIFVVDDEEVIASTIAAILRMKGLNAVAFTSAPEALARSRTMAPDLLITDIMMPVLSGAELAQHIQWRYPQMQGAVIYRAVGQSGCGDCRIRRWAGLSADPQTRSSERIVEESPRDAGHKPQGGRRWRRGRPSSFAYRRKHEGNHCSRPGRHRHERCAKTLDPETSCE